MNGISSVSLGSQQTCPQKTKSIGFGSREGDLPLSCIPRPFFRTGKAGVGKIEICGHTAAEFAPKSNPKTFLSVSKEILCHWAGLNQKKAVVDIKTMAEHGFRI